METFKIVCIKEINHPDTVISMQFGSETTTAEVPGYFVKVGQTSTVTGKMNLRRLIKSGHWAIA